MAGTISRCPSYRQFQWKWLNNGRDQLLVSGLGGVRLSEVAVKETFTVFLCQIEVLDWKRCRKDRKNLSQTTKGYNKRNRTWERNITRFELLHVARYNLGQNLLKPIIKYLFFCIRPVQKAYRRKMKNRLPPPPFPIPILFVVTPEMHTWAFRPNNFEQGLLGWGGLCSR